MTMKRHHQPSIRLAHTSAVRGRVADAGRRVNARRLSARYAALLLVVALTSHLFLMASPLHHLAATGHTESMVAPHAPAMPHAADGAPHQAPHTPRGIAPLEPAHAAPSEIVAERPPAESPHLAPDPSGAITHASHGEHCAIQIAQPAPPLRLTIVGVLTARLAVMPDRAPLPCGGTRPSRPPLIGDAQALLQVFRI